MKSFGSFYFGVDEIQGKTSFYEVGNMFVPSRNRRGRCSFPLGECGFF